MGKLIAKIEKVGGAYDVRDYTGLCEHNICAENVVQWLKHQLGLMDYVASMLEWRSGDNAIKTPFRGDLWRCECGTYLTYVPEPYDGRILCPACWLQKEKRALVNALIEARDKIAALEEKLYPVYLGDPVGGIIESPNVPDAPYVEGSYTFGLIAKNPLCGARISRVECTPVEPGMDVGFRITGLVEFLCRK